LRCPLAIKEEKGFFASLGDSLSSLRLTIALLIILAVASIFGTVIPQNASPEEYLRAYKVPTYKILRILGFLDMYHTGWFLFLLALLSLNLVACSLKRFRTSWRFFSHPQERLDEDQWKALPGSRKFSRKGLPEESLPDYREALSRVFSQPRVLEEPRVHHLFAEKGKLSRLGVYFIHLSVLVILAGALIGSFFGFRGNVNIVEGEAADKVILRSEGQAQPLGFSVRLDKFNISLYPSGAPKEFKSTLTILEGDRPVVTEPIRVNHPLTYRGISLYQSSYGVAGVQKAVLNIKDREARKELAVAAQIGTKTEIPGSTNSFLLAGFIPDFQGMGPALQMIFFEPNHPHENFWILQDHPEFAEKQPGRYAFTIQEIEPKYYSGLQVTKDPGVWVVWVGCFLMMGGFYMTFLLSHRRVWVRLTEKGRETLAEIAGSSHRDRSGFEKELEKIEQELRERPPRERRNSAKSEDPP
jgi:cytochrome c biogenesis protein